MNEALYLQLGVSLLLGLLVGLQRERAQPGIAGIRTFALIAILGTLCAWLGREYGAWIPAAGLLGVAALFVIGYSGRLEGEHRDPGLTTEVAGVLMYCVGAYVAAGPLPVAVVLGGVLAVLLHWKQPLHGMVARIGDGDLKAIMQFVLITLVILPVLPNKTYGPFDVLNPFKTWLMVVLIVGMGLVGYILYKLVSDRVGTLLGGVLGGLVSSTATTVTYARRTRSTGAPVEMAGLVIMLASTVQYARLLVLIGTVAPQRFAALALPVGAMLAWCVLIAATYYRQVRGGKSDSAAHENPAELKFALGFGALYAFLLVVVAAARDWFGTGGLYVVAGISGLPDVDAISLSTLQLLGDDRIGPGMAWRLIIVASLANLMLKAGLAGVLGSRQLFRSIAWRFGAALIGGVLLMVLWPK